MTQTEIAIGPARVQSIFLDIVGFTKGRTVDAQSDVIGKLNSITQAALKTLGVSIKDTILIPTGDGLAIALVYLGEFDLQIRIALEILKLTSEHNKQEKNKTRKFEVRIGINENTDNVVIDINGRANVAGAGISMAQRIMDKGDGGHILVGETVHAFLAQRDKYDQKFHRYDTTGKHGVRFPVYQYIAPDHIGLTVTPPAGFIPRQEKEPLFSMEVAYYVGLAALNRDMFLALKKSGQLRESAAIHLLRCLSEDATEEAETPEFETPHPITWGKGQPLIQRYEHYAKLDFWALRDLADLAVFKHLGPFERYFESDGVLPNFLYVQDSALQKLKTEFPNIARSCGIG